jgi:hypothetical protein
MKTIRIINLSALSQVTLEDTGILLRWLETQPTRDVSLEQLKKTPAVRTSKVTPLLKIFEEIGFVSKKQNRFTVTGAGSEFTRCGLSEKKAFMRALFVKINEVERVMNLLQASPTGRVRRQLVFEAFAANSLSQILDSDLQGFISWAVSCDLFGYDKKSEEVFTLESDRPRGPVPGPIDSRPIGNLANVS